MIKKIFRFLFYDNKKSKNKHINENSEDTKELYVKMNEQNSVKIVLHEDTFDKLNLPFIIPKERLLSHNEFLALIKQERNFTLIKVLPENKDYYHKLIYYFRKKHSMSIVFLKTTNSYKYYKDVE